MPDVFINYRTGDGEQAAATIEEALSARFGKDRIYFASKSIPPGTPFDGHLIHGVRRSGVLLALIGPGWTGHAALRSDGDWVRREIQEAFLCDIRVIPVLVGRRTERPAKDELPVPLRKLTDCQSLRYDHQNKEYDLKQIGDTLARLVPELAAVDREAHTELPPSATHHNTAGDTYGTGVQGTVNGDVSTVREAHGPVHIGPSNVRMGDGGNYFQGGVEGGFRQNFDRSRPEEDDER
ncbi:toll/interleukin-1 receptor domain-containing protein [Streptomyces ferrugineus]|uniref:Toll/interleukin-1 receptor domain-containing protein n=1 Tax=Streptomyces ferrugineus TaxID=1413221 RepID=A0A7M2STS1_9ACTN|nr:toll/interleukin-1 receptor domain-containing protein [Streptomyces ferrugineus]QOV39634.1 toll/interleukin-1 receptor domain-containing protein [Streptomyces ferrugineus]